MGKEEESKEKEEEEEKNNEKREPGKRLSQREADLNQADQDHHHQVLFQR